MSATVSPETVGLSSARLQRVSRWMATQVRDGRLPGLSVLIARRGQVALYEHVGHMDVEQGKPMADDTIVRIYSMTKPVTSVAAMMLYEAGAFQLDDPIAAFLPAFADVRVWRGGTAPVTETVAAERPITVRHLLTQTSGLTYAFMQATPVDALYRQEGICFTDAEASFGALSGSLADKVDHLATVPLLCQPGSEWNYSVATDVVGRLVEVWSGQPLDRFFQKHIFAPLGMDDTAFTVPADKLERFAACYGQRGGADLSRVHQPGTGAETGRRGRGTGLKLLDTPATSRFLQPTRLYSGGGGLTSTMADYTRFCQMLLNRGELDGQRLLGRKTVEYMTTNHLPGNRDMAAMGQPVWSETNYEGIGFGLGFAVVLDPVTAQVLGSAGEYHWGGAASTAFWIDPAEELYVILLTQLIPSSAYPLRRELRVLTYQAIVA